MTASLLVRLVPVEVDGPSARELARREIAKPIYQEQLPGPVERLRDWVAERFGSALDSAGSVSPAGIWGWIALLLIIGLAIAAIGVRVGGVRRSAAVGGTNLLESRLSAAAHRSEAEAHARAGRWPEAVRERLRAIVRTAEEAGVIEARPGRTTEEIAADCGTALPSLAGDFVAAARAFDDIWYGGRPGTSEAYTVMTRLDDRLRRAGRVEVVR